MMTTYVIGGTQATARFCCCFAAMSNGAIGNGGSSAEPMVQPAQLLKLAVLLLTMAVLSPTFCQHKYTSHLTSTQATVWSGGYHVVSISIAVQR